MKNIKALLIGVCLVVLLCFSSCMITQGDPGLSAYEIAVKNGFVGTEQEWLDSLKGETVYVPIESETESESESKDNSDKVEQSTTIIEQTINQNITKNEITIEGESIDVSEAVKKGLRSVVSVFCNFTTKGSSPLNPAQTYSSAGSGVIYKINDDGSALVITNFHVVYDSNCSTANKISDDIGLFLYGAEISAREISATYVGGSMNYDIAILKIEAGNEVFFDAISRGIVSGAVVSDTPVNVGDTVIAIGNPEAGGISATSGVVSVDSEYINMTGADNATQVEFRVIRTDTAINSGNSGGGLFNANGELVGIVNAKIMSSNVENIGYALPVGVVVPVSENIIYYCIDTDCETVMRPLLGISVQITDMWTESDAETGALIKNEQSTIVLVNEGSASEGKLLANDIIKSITIGERTVQIRRQYQIIDTILNARQGDIVKVGVIRELNGVPTEITVDIEITENNISAYK